MRIQEEKGFTLLEIIIAISILTVGLLAVASMQASALRGDSFASRVTEGTTWAQDKLEGLLAQPYNGMTSGGPQSTPDNKFAIQWTVANGSIANTKRITVIVKRGSKEVSNLSICRSQLL